MKRFSWIVTSLVLYFTGLVIFMLQDDVDEFWVSYFYCVNAYLICVSLAFNFKRIKTGMEMMAISYTFFFRTLLLVYYILCDFILKNKDFMNSSIGWWIIFGVAGMLTVLFGKHNSYGKQ